MKVVVLVCGGLGDEPSGDLGGRTPLEHAATPTLDRLAARGILGLTRTVPRGLPPGTEVGLQSVLGYEPTRQRAGTAAFEAASLGVELGPTDVAYRCDLVTLGTPEGGVEVLRDVAGGHPSASEVADLVRDLGSALGDAALELHPGLGHRQLLVWRGGRADVHTVAPEDVLDRPVAAHLPQGPGAEVLCGVMDRARDVLAAHRRCVERRARGERAPSAVWLWGQGNRVTLPPLRQRVGLEGAMVAALDVAKGVGRVAGLVPVAVPGATGEPDTAYRAKAEHALGALAERDLVVAHVAGADACGHAGDAVRKAEVIERFDAEVVAPVVEGLRGAGSDWRLLVVGDHATPCTQRRHTDDPVPFLVALPGDEDKPRSLERRFHEKDAREQGIFVVDGHTLMERLVRR